MTKPFVVCVVISVLVLMACSGGGAMTVEEYASACAGLGDRFSDSEAGDLLGLSYMEEIVDELQGWNPPEELREFHELYVEAADISVRALQESGFIELMEEIEEAQRGNDPERAAELMGKVAEVEQETKEFEKALEDLDKRLSEAKQDIPPATRNALASGGCGLLELF